jgi:hypothetical protein
MHDPPPSIHRSLTLADSNSCETVTGVENGKKVGSGINAYTAPVQRGGGVSLHAPEPRPDDAVPLCHIIPFKSISCSKPQASLVVRPCPCPIQHDSSPKCTHIQHLVDVQPGLG